MSMRDRTIYTQESCEAIIRHIRMYREILKDEESRILMLYEASKHHKCPVDSMGRAYKERRSKFKVPEFAPPYLIQALQGGETQVLPGHQD